MRAMLPDVVGPVDAKNKNTNILHKHLYFATIVSHDTNTIIRWQI